MGFGPNGVRFTIRRAMRDIGGVPLMEGGCIARHPHTGEILWEPLRDERGNILYHDELEITESTNVTCNAGLEAAKSRLFESATTETVAKYIALSSSSSSPVNTWTEIPAEITTGGLERAVATYAGNGTGVCKLTHQFTASATHTDVQLMGLLDNVINGSDDLYFAATITPATLISGDQLTAEWDPITLS